MELAIGPSSCMLWEYCHEPKNCSRAIRKQKLRIVRAIELATDLNNPYDLCTCLYEKADLHHLQGQYAECRTLAQEALTIAEQVGENDVLFSTQLLLIRLRWPCKRYDSQDAVDELEVMLEDERDEAEQAALYYEIWRLQPLRQTIAREKAASLYRALYGRTPNAIYHQRYHSLTGESLASSAILPPVPELLHRTSVDLESLLQRAGVQLPIA